MKLEDCAKLEEKYTRLAVEQTNMLHNPDRKVQASLSVMEQLHDARVDLAYPPSALYCVARTALLGAAVTLATVTSFAVYELRHVHREDKKSMHEQIETLDAQKKYAQAQAAYDVRGLTDTIGTMRQAYHELSEQLTRAQQALEDARNSLADAEQQYQDDLFQMLDNGDDAKIKIMNHSVTTITSRFQRYNKAIDRIFADFEKFIAGAE